MSDENPPCVESRRVMCRVDADGQDEDSSTTAVCVCVSMQCDACGRSFHMEETIPPRA
jgi:hypothetical protein